MQEHYSNTIAVTAVMLKQNSQHAWGSDQWQLLGLHPGMEEKTLTKFKTNEGHINWSGLRLNLHAVHCAAYYQNLISRQPKAFLICYENKDGQPEPLLVSVDQDEAAAYLETGELVFSVALSESLCFWLERFVLCHYQPEQTQKRQRQQWHREDRLS